MSPSPTGRRGTRRARLPGAALAALGLLASAPAARAEFTQASLLSGTSQQQFEHASDPALSEDGDYAVFRGSLAGVPGIYRRDLQSGAIEPVAVETQPGAPAQEGVPDATGASAPSVSANGQYIAFTTTGDLDPAEPPAQEGEPATDRGCPEVYVRNMYIAPDRPGAYTLASALDESDEGIALEGCSSGSGGAQSTPNGAISAEGEYVVFTVFSPSNLRPEAGSPCPSTTGPTPPSQVAVRDLQTRATTLVSVTPQGCPTPGGGAYPSAASESRNAGADASAVISADASTVAWLGTDVGEQVPTAKQEIEAGFKGEGGRSGESGEVEPLWRRVANGSNATTRRLLGDAGINLYFRSFLTEPAVFGGAFVDSSGGLPSVPIAISKDGRTVATLANAPTPAAEASAMELEATPDTDAYLVQVENETAPPRVTPLTATPDYLPRFSPRTEEVSDIALSPDGTHVAFDTARTQFVLPTLTDISPPSAFTEVPETYEANLQAGTLQRVTLTYDGAEPNGPAYTLALSADGSQIAFTSQATNLFYGDSLRESEVYLAAEAQAATQVASQEVGPLPAPPLPTPEWLLSATVQAQAGGRALVRAQVPGAGTLAAAAGAELPASAGAAVKPRRGRAAHAKAGRRARTAGRRRGASPEKSARRPRLSTRTVASAKKTSAAAGELELEISLGSTYRKLAAAQDGLYTAVRVTFAAPGHKTLSEEVPVTFHRSASAGTARAARGRSAARRGRHGGRRRPGAAG